MEEHSLLLEFCIPLSHYCAEMPFEIVIEPFWEIVLPLKVLEVSPFLGLFWKKKKMGVFLSSMCPVSILFPFQWFYGPFGSGTYRLRHVEI